MTAYNTLQTSVAGLGSYDAASGTAGPMLGDPLLTGVQNQIRHVLQTVDGNTALLDARQHRHHDAKGWHARRQFRQAAGPR